MLPADAASGWLALAPLIPAGAYLVGGTALAVHLRHRLSQDLDFFLDQEMDLDVLVRELRAAGPFAVVLREPGTLNGVFSATGVQFLSALGQRRLEPTTNVAGIGDILATKLKAIGGRGELRDYFGIPRSPRTSAGSPTTSRSTAASTWPTSTVRPRPASATAGTAPGAIPPARSSQSTPRCGSCSDSTRSACTSPTASR